MLLQVDLGMEVCVGNRNQCFMRMFNMRMKIDIWCKGLDEGFREGIREQVRDLFCQLPAHRIWYYLKFVRGVLLNDSRANWNIRLDLDSDRILNGPEDTIARGDIFFDVS
jgi:hypothetical protein